MKAAYTETEEPVTAPSIKQSASAAASETEDSALPVPVTSARSTPPVTEKVDDTAPTQIIQTDVVDLSKPTVPPSTAVPASGTEASTEANELPPLPADLSGPRAQRDAIVESAPSPVTESVTPTPADGLGSELPPLPSDLSRRKSHCRSTGIATDFGIRHQSRRHLALLTTRKKSRTGCFSVRWKPDCKCTDGSSCPGVRATCRYRGKLKHKGGSTGHWY